MHDLFDYRTLAAAFALKSFLQALALIYVWYVDRRYPPARKWAIGSLVIAAGTLLLTPNGSDFSMTVLVVRILLIYTGLFILGIGILEACVARPREEIFAAFWSLACLAQIWVSLHTPSVDVRVGVFSFSVACAASGVGACALNAPEGPLQGTQRLIGLLLVVQSVIALLQGLTAFDAHLILGAHSTALQIGFILVSTCVSFLLALALTLLTGQRTSALLAIVLDNLDQGVALYDRNKRLVICNKRYGELYGVDPRGLQPGTTVASIIARRIANGYFNGASPQRYFEQRTTPALEDAAELQQLADGRSIVISRRPMRWGGWLTAHSDVTALQRVQAQVAWLAHHDSLTGLANRQLFGERMKEELDHLALEGDGFAILLVDLDRFKAINDTLGHPGGDALLVEVAERLRSCVAETDVVARLGGDEFAIIRMTGAARETTANLAKQLLDKVGAAYDLNGQKVMIGASIGIATAPESGTDADQLMRNADLALYRAKAEGRSCYRIYDKGMDASVRARHSLELALRNSIVSQDFRLEYQPIVNADCSDVVGAEALLRWHHPSGTIIEPSKFIGIAEETGLIVPLGEWILRQACLDALAWPDKARVCVNLSAVQFTSGNICESLEAILQDTLLPPGRLQLEVTESILLHGGDEMLSPLHRLRDRGVSLTLDGFGTGYSSLSYLTKFPFDRIKIDQSFVAGLGTRRECSAIVAAIAGVARSLDMAVAAEGVETVEQYDLLRLAGCREMQGFLFGKPCSVADLVFSDAPQQHLAGQRQNQNLSYGIGL
ncbi:MAG: EAL domain-containing protein [Beijerinckiaceae bacterium]|nr:MAG: EAL domain-containing protein [Beijerinckiaceae bacterium]